ncbi:MAG: leucyl aminopeptidase [Gammaproteobacteria bacterium]|nr:leucyl aminopeptidase [Gammaproteobacteria bacterium]MCP5136957.1 leucyl aminopeptidase [Gammaproteobacteria bacterium]
MEYAVKSGSPEKQRTPCVVVGVFDSRRMSDAAKAMDDASEGAISAILRRGDMDGKAGQTLLLGQLPNTFADRVLLVGCGKERDFNEAAFAKAIALATQQLNNTGSIEAVLYFPELNVKGRDTAWKVRASVESIEDALYRFDAMKSSGDEAPRRPLKRVVIAVTRRKELTESELALEEGIAIAAGKKLTRDLGNLPGNVCTPSYLADQATKLASDSDLLSCAVLEEADMEKLGMGSLLSVSRGSRQPAKLIVMEYRGGAQDEKPIVLVGKGVTFDSGGISLKPGAAMDEMKYDMCGAASVFGVMQAVLQLRLAINLVGIIPTTENLPDGAATKPGDIVTAMNGTTIEILNTDAEGRLILCDALTYAERFEPDCVIDIATLTGACAIALGKQATGLFSNTSALANELLNAGRYTMDRAWEMPLWPEYEDQLKSNFADVANIGGREAGTVTAACFLSKFTRKQRWAHLDIAGTAWNSGADKGATGRPVPLLTQFVLDRCVE